MFSTTQRNCQMTNKLKCPVIVCLANGEVFPCHNPCYAASDRCWEHTIKEPTHPECQHWLSWEHKIQCLCPSILGTELCPEHTPKFDTSAADERIEKEELCLTTHPGFIITCEKCRSTMVYTQDTRGNSDERGSWGAFSLICLNCNNRFHLIDN